MSQHCSQIFSWSPHSFPLSSQTLPNSYPFSQAYEMFSGLLHWFPGCLSQLLSHVGTLAGFAIQEVQRHQKNPDTLGPPRDVVEAFLLKMAQVGTLGRQMGSMISIMSASLLLSLSSCLFFCPWYAVPISHLFAAMWLIQTLIVSVLSPEIPHYHIIHPPFSRTLLMNYDHSLINSGTISY